MSAEALSAAALRFHDDLSRWPRSKWSSPDARGVTRSDAAFALVQQLADLAATAEGQPRRRVPRLDGDTVITDQLRVVVADLVTASAPPPVLLQATRLIETTYAGLAAE